MSEAALSRVAHRLAASDAVRSARNLGLGCADHKAVVRADRGDP
jgi:hypothetical protein